MKSYSSEVREVLIATSRRGFVDHSTTPVSEIARDGLVPYLREGISSLNFVITKGLDSSDQIKLLSDFLQKNKSDLSLKLQFDETINPADFRELMATIKSNRNIKKLDVAIAENATLDKSILVDFIKEDSCNRLLGLSLEGARSDELDSLMTAIARNRRVNCYELKLNRIVTNLEFFVATSQCEALKSLAITGLDSRPGARSFTPHVKLIPDEIYPQFIDALARGVWPKLSSLDLSKSKFTAKQASNLLSTILNSDRDNISINLSNNDLGDEGAEIIAQLLSAHSAKKITLDLSNTNISDVGQELLSKAVLRSRAKIYLNDGVILNSAYGKDEDSREPRGEIEKATLGESIKKGKKCSVM